MQQDLANVQDYYWSSSTHADDTGYAWFVCMHGALGYGTKSNGYYVWPVRSGQYWTSGPLVIAGTADYGTQAVGSVSSGHQFTLKNSGTSMLPVTGIVLGGTNANQFTLVPGDSSPCASLTPTLAAGASCTVLVAARMPTSVGSKIAALTVTTGVGSTSIPLTATSTPLSVTYNGNGNSAGSVPSDSNTAYLPGNTVTVLGNSGALARSGYVFDGWNTAANASGTSYAVGATFAITTSTTLYAKWTPPIAPLSGLTSWWRGEDNGVDTAGGLSATLTSGMTYTPGKVGQAFGFNGAPSTAYISVPDNPKLNFGTSEFSLAVWLKTTDSGFRKRIMAKRSSGAVTWYSLALDYGKVTLEITADDVITSSVSVADGRWHHVAFTRDPAGSSPRYYHLYINGVENKLLGDSGLNLDNTGPLEIGKWYNENLYTTIFTGAMDELQLFNRALTSAEVQSIYNAGSAGLAPPPTVTGVSPQTGPATGGISVTITGTGLGNATAVKFGTTDATSFTINSDSQIIATAPAVPGGPTVDITVTTPGGTSAASSADRFTYTLVDQAISFGTAPAIAVGGKGDVSATASSGLAVTFSSQTPSVCTISGATVSGVALGTCTIAADQSGNGFYNPAAQKTQSFTITSPLSIIYNGNGNSGGSVPGDSTVYASGNTVIVLGNSGALLKSGYVFSGWNRADDGRGTSYTPGEAFTISATTTLYAWWTVALAPPAGLVSWWRGEGNATDTRGINNGTLHSATTFAFAAGEVGQAFSFSGATTEYIDVNDNSTLNFGTNEFSLAVWLKTTDNGSRKRIMAKRSSSAAAWYSLALDSGKATLEITGADTITSSVSVADGQWHHVAFTRDPVATSPRKYHLYIDGVENNTMDDSGADLDNTGPLEIGKWNTEAEGGAIFSGAIDEVQLFNRALTSAEIQSIYNAGSAGLTPPPTVTAVSPSSGPAIGGTQVVITGTNLADVSAVTFGGTAAPSVTFNSPTQVTSVSPAAVAGLVADITVTTPGGASAVSSADQFTYTQDQARNITTGTTYTTLAAALSAALPGAEIRAYDSQLDGAFTLDKGLALKGGYDGTFLVKGSNPTTLNGGLTVTSGASTVETVVVEGVLAVQGGSLGVNDVTVQ